MTSIDRAYEVDKIINGIGQHIGWGVFEWKSTGKYWSCRRGNKMPINSKKEALAALNQVVRADMNA